MTFLVLYDNRGQCQRVAATLNPQPFIDVGFEVVTQDEYNRCAELVPEATEADLRDIQVAQSLVNRIGNQTPQGNQTINPNPRALERLQNRHRDNLQAITQSYLDGRISLAQWQRQMTDAINQANLAATALGVGSFENLTQDDIRAVERENETQAGYLTRFRRELDNLSPAKAIARAGLYAGATTSRYWTAHTRAGGLVLPAMPGVRTTCGSNCKCNWNILKLEGVGNWDCQWRLSAIESCEECIRRQRVFNPLKVRNFIVQPFNPNGIYV